MDHSIVKTSLFLVAMSSAQSAVASTCALGHYDPNNGSNCILSPFGTYVPSSGASQVIPADLGHYVSAQGASAQTAAAPGRYVPNTGASSSISAQPGYFVPDFASSSQTAASQGYYVANFQASEQAAAVAGFYVPNSTSSAPTAVSHGFYTATTASVNQISGGGVAAPLTSAIQSETLLSRIALDLIEADLKTRLKLALSYEQDSVTQVGVTTGKLKSQISALTLQADLLKIQTQKIGLVLGYSHNTLKNTNEIHSSDNIYQLGVFDAFAWRNINLLGMLTYGQANANLTREVDVSYNPSGGAVITNHESLIGKGKVSWYGLQSKAVYPFHFMNHSFASFMQLGVLSFQAKAFNESGTATASGSSVTALAPLSVNSLHYTRIPVTLGVNYDVFGKTPLQSVGPLIVTLGVSKALGGQKHLTAIPQSSTHDTLDIPVAMTSKTMGLMKLTLSSLELMQGLTLSGVAQAELGSGVSTYQGSLKLAQEF